MANQAISQLPSATGIIGSELVPVVQNGVTVRVTVAQIAGYAQQTPGAALAFQAPIQRTGNSVFINFSPAWPSTVGGLVYPKDSATLGVTAAGLIGQVLIGSGVSAAASWLSAGTTGQLLVSNSGLSPSWLAAGVSGQVLVGNTGGNPFWTATVPGTAAVDSFSGGTTGLTPNSPTSGNVVLGGLLAVPSGGTGVATSTGTGSVVLNIQPSIVSAALTTPAIGVATGTSLNLGTGTLTAGLLSATTILGLAAGSNTVAQVSAGAVFPTIDLGAALGTSTRRWSDLRTNTATLGGALTYGGVTLSAAVTGTGPMVLGIAPTLSSPVVGTQLANNNSNLAASTQYADRVLANLVIVVSSFTASTTWTVNANMVYAQLECWGAGGGGGGAANSNASNSALGGGGGAGSYSRKTVTASTVGASQVATIGAAGSAGTAGNNAGGTGGDTSIGTLCVGKGGIGGSGNPGAGGPVATGGLGGVAGTGDITSTGMPGGSTVGPGTGLSFMTNAGGSTLVGGGGGNTGITQGSGIAGTGHGSGGSGGASVTAGGAAAGGAGTAGYIVITEFCTH